MAEFKKAGAWRQKPEVAGYIVFPRKKGSSKWEMALPPLSNLKGCPQRPISSSETPPPKSVPPAGDQVFKHMGSKGDISHSSHKTKWVPGTEIVHAKAQVAAMRIC